MHVLEIKIPTYVCIYVGSLNFFAQTLGGYYYCEPHDPFLLEINHVLFLIIRSTTFDHSHKSRKVSV